MVQLGRVIMRSEVDAFKYVVETNKLLKGGGLLLVAKGKTGKPNAMTIGWGFLGTMWSRPVFIVAVRKSRHTYKLLEESTTFSVCLPSRDMKEALTICGTKSGRDMDKFNEMGFTELDGKKIGTPYIKECPVHIECKVIYKDTMIPGQLNEEVEKKMYSTLDMHTLYYGEIKGVFASDDVDEKLAK